MASFGVETAKLLLDIGAININEREPYRLTSGWASPVYVDVRKVMTYPQIRSRIVDMAVATISEEIGLANIDMIAGGETAGIPFAAWIADRLDMPMIYVRKVPKGVGLGRQIEGEIRQNKRVLLVEDHLTDGGSKINFVKALRGAQLLVEHTFVVFAYDIFSHAQKLLEGHHIQLHRLTNWRSTIKVATQSAAFSESGLRTAREFIATPYQWSQGHGGLAEPSYLARLA